MTPWIVFRSHAMFQLRFSSRHVESQALVAPEMCAKPFSFAVLHAILSFPMAPRKIAKPLGGKRQARL